MAPVVGKPIIQHILELLAQADVGEVHVNVHHLADAIVGTYGDTTYVNSVRMCINARGAAYGDGRRREAHGRLLRQNLRSHHGDALTDVDVREVSAFHRESKALATLALMRVADTSRYGVVELDS